MMHGSSCPKLFLGKGVMKVCSKFTGEHLCQSVILLKLQSNFIEIAYRHGCSPVNLPHIFRTPFLPGEHPFRCVISIKLLFLRIGNSIKDACQGLIHVRNIRPDANFRKMQSV